MDQPTYNKNEFIAACKTGNSVVVPERVLATAASDLSLRSKKEILDFIGNDGLANCKLDLSRPYDKWKGKPPAPMVDSYRFTSGSKHGYIAYYRGFDGAWILKSLKADSKSVESKLKADVKPTELTFKGLAGLAELLAQREEPEEKKDGK